MARLAPNGVFYSHCHEGASAPARLPCSTVEPALEAAGLTVVHDAETLPAQGRAAFFTITSG